VATAAAPDVTEAVAVTGAEVFVVAKVCGAVVVDDLAVVALVAVVVLDFLVVVVDVAVVVVEEAFEVTVVVVEVGELTADEAADEAAAAALLQPAGGLSPQHPIVSGCRPKF